MHLDVMDGHFVPNITFGPMMVKAVRGASRKPFDAHLMVSRPGVYAAAFAEAGADLISFHLESEDRPQEVIRRIRVLKKQVGLAVKPATPVEGLKGLLKDVDFAVVMTVEPGFGGQSFMPAMLAKVQELRKLRGALGLNYLIQVDGGIDEKTAPLALSAGADVLVAGSAVFGRPNWGRAIQGLRGAHA